MARIFRLVLLGIIGAAIVHIAVLFLVPFYSDKNAWSRIETGSEPYRFQRLDQKTGPVSDSDPLIQEATCRFDLADGPVHITTGANVPYWSLSIYAPNGDNLYSLNDSVSNERKLDLILADPIGMALGWFAGRCAFDPDRAEYRRRRRCAARFRARCNVEQASAALLHRSALCAV